MHPKGDLCMQGHARRRRARHLTDTACQRTSLHHTANAGCVGEPRTLTAPSPPHASPSIAGGGWHAGGGERGEPRPDLPPQIAQVVQQHGDVGGLGDFGPARRPGAARPLDGLVQLCLAAAQAVCGRRADACRWTGFLNRAVLANCRRPRRA